MPVAAAAAPRVVPAADVEAGLQPGRRCAREAFFDAVLEPGEFASGEDRGPTVARRDDAHGWRRSSSATTPRSCRGPAPRPSSDSSPASVNVLVQLGQGEEVRETVDRCLRHLAGREGVQVAALSSAIAGLLDVPAGVVHLDATYPMSRYYAAFDLRGRPRPATTPTTS